MKAYYSNRQKEFLRDRRDEYIAAGQWNATDDRCWDRLADDFEKALDDGIVERRSNVENCQTLDTPGHAPPRTGDERVWTDPNG